MMHSLDALPAPLPALLRELQAGLQHLYGFRLLGLTLYGSYARAQAVPGSDIDVAVVLDDFSSAGAEVTACADLIGRLSLQYGCVLSLAPIRRRDWQTRQTPFLLNIRREGVAIT